MSDRSNYPGILRNHSRLAIAVVAGILVGVLLPGTISPRLRAVYGWDVLAVTFVGLALWTLARASRLEALKQSAAREDQSRWVILIVMSAAAFISLIAIGTLLTNTKDLPPMVAHRHIAFAALTVLASWVMIHMLFAIHYAHEFYGDGDPTAVGYSPRGGLQFPATEEPVFSDFVYYSFVIGMTCQVSDVQIADRHMRKLATAHGILSFFFNTIVLALSVNIASGLVS